MVYLRNVFSKPLAGMWTGQPLPVQTMASMQLGNMASSKNNAATCCYNLQFETSTKAGAMKQQIEEAGPGCEWPWMPVASPASTIVWVSPIPWSYSPCPMIVQCSLSFHRKNWTHENLRQIARNDRWNAHFLVLLVRTSWRKSWLLRKLVLS